ncbi:MAG TPA: retroviral-like aspartic protease family protein [Polyangiaceae bacterium]|jgi:predicted aspartyl protease
MGHVFVEAELSWTTDERVRLLADTGATYTVIPADAARRLGIAVSPRPMNVTLADGSSRPMHFGTALMKLHDREAGVTLLIAPEGAEALLGVEALEALGLAVDPTSHQLRPTRAHGVLAVGVMSNR